MSFKLHQASWRGGKLAREPLVHPREPGNTEGGVGYIVNTIVRVTGSLGQTNVQFVLDSGAGVSVVDYRVVEELYGDRIQKDGGAAPIGANGLPLHVVGKIQLPVKLGCFQQDQVFIVVRNLSVECLLGADFLVHSEAILDCKVGKLSLKGTEVPITMGTGRSSPDTTAMPVQVSETIEIPARSVMLIQATVQGGPSVTSVQEGLLEPSYPSNFPKHVIVARSLSEIRQNQTIFAQVVNISPDTVTLYKGMRFGEFTPRQLVHIVDELQEPDISPRTTEKPEFDLTQSDLSEAEKAQLAELITEFSDLFTSPLGCTSVVQHEIVTEGRPIRQPVRRVPAALQEVVETEVRNMLQLGVVRPSHSPWSSPIVMVRKKDGSWRFCVDFRKLNAVTHRDAYPLPRIDATLDTLHGAKLFTTLDLASGYWQVEVKEEDKEKTAFSTPQGHFEFNKMPFGLTNAPATFQRLMECILAGLTGDECLIYIDDIVVFSRTFLEHLQRLRRVFQRLRDASLRLKPPKCKFARKEVHYLGHIVSAEGVRTDPDKTKAVKEYPIPHDVKQLRQFLGLTNYYRRFIKDYSLLATPLFHLTRKTAKGFLWSSSCQQAFETLKQKLVTPPILAYPDFTRPFILQTDASDQAIGAVLSQEREGQEHVISYWSRRLDKSERNYSTIEREALAAISALKEFYPYVYGFPCRLVTDHNPLTALKGLKDVGGRLSRWMLFLQQFALEVVYKPGKQHTNADSLSRVPSDMVSVAAIAPSDSTGTMITATAQAQDPALTKVIKLLAQNKPLHSSDVAPGLTRAYLKDGLLCREFNDSTTKTNHVQLVVPAGLRETILTYLHNQSGHLGIRKTMEKVKARYYWPGYELDIEKWVRECVECQRRNPPPRKPQAPLGTITASYPFEKITWDIMGPLPASERGNLYILVVTDVFSKWVEAFAIRNTVATTLARVLVDEVICRYGVPKSIHSDQGANLCGEVVQGICNLLKIDRTRTSAYHPMGNGQVERFNRTVEAMLAKMVKESQRDWDRHLQKALFAYRTSLHETTGFTPYHLNFGRSPTLPIDVVVGQPSQAYPSYPEFVQDTHNQLHLAYQCTRERLHAAHQRQKQAHDRKSSGEKLRVGDRVWLYNPAIKQGRTKKFANLWRGPYTIVDKTGPVNYRIQLIGGSQTLIVHYNRIKLCYGPPTINRPPKQVQVPVRSPDTSESAGDTTPATPPAAVAARDTGAALYSDVLAGRAPVGGYTSAEGVPEPPAHTRTHPQRDRRNPNWYGDVVRH